MRYKGFMKGRILLFIIRYLELEYFDYLGAIRQIKFPILCEYDAKTFEMKILALSEDLIQL